VALTEGNYNVSDWRTTMAFSERNYNVTNCGELQWLWELQ